MTTTTAFDLGALTAEFKRAMQALYGDRLAKVILYGSYARGDFHAGSDVDFMVVLKDETVIRMHEFNHTYPITSALTEKYNADVSVVPVDENRYRQSDYLFFCNVRREGIVL